MPEQQKLPSSFRDPSGFVFVKDGIVFRQINQGYKQEYELLIESGLYKALSDDSLLLRHEEVDAVFDQDAVDGFKVIKPDQVGFISYPYEWCFSQLKDAALLTLAIQKQALERQMSLKDASAYNVQFLGGKPILIDTLSFEKYEEGLPWVAYKQFSQHFLAPLALMAHRDLRLGKLLQTNIDGIPLDLAAGLLPKSTLVDLGVLTHVHMQARFQTKYSKQEASSTLTERKLSKTALLGIVENLESTIKGLKLKGYDSFWRDYYREHNYSDTAFNSKKAIVEEQVTALAPGTVWDLGANTGVFSRLASKQGIFTLSTDMDALTVEANYQKARDEGDKNLLPLIVDLSQPAPAIGWANSERMSFSQRGPGDFVLALALIHHLAIGNNVPLRSIAEYLSSLSKFLLIEFVPKSDSQVRELLRMREDVFPDYNETGFETAFSAYFSIERKIPLADCDRTMYLLKRL